MKLAKLKTQKRTMQNIVKDINQNNIFRSYRYDRLYILNFEFCLVSIHLLLINKKRFEKVHFALSNNKNTFLLLKKINKLSNRKVFFLEKNKKIKLKDHSIYKTL